MAGKIAEAKSFLCFKKRVIRIIRMIIEVVVYKNQSLFPMKSVKISQHKIEMIMVIKCKI